MVSLPGSEALRREQGHGKLEIATGYTARTKPPLALLTTVEGRVSRYDVQHGRSVPALRVLRNFEAALVRDGFRTIVVAPVSRLAQYQGVYRDEAYFGAFQRDQGGAPAIYVNVVADPNAGAPRSEVTIVQPTEMTLRNAQEPESILGNLQDAGLAKAGGR